MNLTEPDIPIYSDLQSHPDSYTNQYIEFVNTDLYKDVAQTTVPFIDIQPVEPLIKGPLSGAGIIHKGTPGFGGFLAPTIMTYDYREKFQAIFSDENSFPRNGNQLKLVHRKEN